MGSIMVYRYRPMRVVPTITTSVLIARGSFLLGGDIMVGGKGRQQAIAPIFYLSGGILRHFVAQIAACREFPGIRRENWPFCVRIRRSESVRPMSETGMIITFFCATLNVQGAKPGGLKCCRTWLILAAIQSIVRIHRLMIG
ncbi:hypothetical protein [Ruegeria atlantica]|uniref:Uncharacterized protein n=1 Tax=Ruegeria atlantica TaxID=81569 RepID=A0ABX1W6H8_9RHOB|nr:hypothetical protein [Ruegeria atlantica]NOD29222.1 hypothetical protein [Ruegeria atlantica]